MDKTEDFHISKVALEDIARISVKYLEIADCTTDLLGHKLKFSKKSVNMFNLFISD